MQFESFGQLPSGETVRRYTLANDAGTAVQVITYGAIITSLRVPDHQGQLTDVVLGFDHLADYLAPHPYFGAIAGRVAGRITAGRFELEGRTHALNINNPPNHLHGGPIGFDRHLWQAKPVSRPDRAPSLRLETTSPDGDQGYPGNVTVAVTYTLTANHTLIVDSEATTDQSTPFNLTQHTYFNLRGEHSGSAVDHLLEIPATTYAPMDQDSTLLGRREPVIPGGNDFTAPRPLTQAIPRLNLHHGDLFSAGTPTRHRPTRTPFCRPPA
jgi:aldose 1-epimerase